MKCVPPLASAALLLALIGSPSASPAAENQCVACHEHATSAIALGHSFGEWKTSAHGVHGVTCDACHGGDPTTSDPDVAHQGVLPAAEEGSRVRSTELAATCGRCHVAERQAYEKTIHARRIQALGRGATCMTCHDAVGNHLPSPAELASRCAACHEEPLRAHVALAMLATTGSRLRAARRDVDETAGAEADWHRNASERLDDLESRYHTVQIEWHTFAVEELIRDSRDILSLTKLLDDEARKHLEMEQRDPARDEDAPASE